MMMLTKVNPHPDEAYTNAADAAIITVLAAAKAIFIKIAPDMPLQVFFLSLRPKFCQFIATFVQNY